MSQPDTLEPRRASFARAEAPRLLVLTDRSQTNARPLADVVRPAVDAGAQFVILREKDLPSAERAALAEQLRRIVPNLIVASDGTIAADGVHLAAEEPFVSAPIIGRSCHTRSELERAAEDGCDYATFSPVFASESKPGYGPPIGIDSLAAACRDMPLPTYALGGIEPSNASRCIDAGVTGVAVMGCVMRAQDPSLVVKELLR